MSLDEGKSSSVVQNTSIASSPVGPMIISVIKARLSICSYAASLSAGVRLRRSTLYILLTVSPSFKEIIPIAKNNYKEIDQTMRSKNFNDALKKAINGNWPLEKKRGLKLVREYRSRSDNRSIKVTIESPDVELGLELLKELHGGVRRMRRRRKESGGPEPGYSVKLFQPTDRPLQDHRSLSNRQARPLRPHRS